MKARKTYPRTVNQPVSNIPVVLGGDGRYMYWLCAGDQTVAVLDCSNHTVSTIALTAGKTFSMLFLVAQDKVVYVLGISYFNKIDIDPISGSFHTVVASGATLITDPKNFSYLPFPLHSLAGAGSTMFIPVEHLNDTNYFLKWFSKDGRYGGDPLGALSTFLYNVRLYPNSKLISYEGIGLMDFCKIYPSFRGVKTTTPFTLKRIDTISADLYQGAIATYVFGNFLVGGTSGALYILSKDYCYAPIWYFPAGSTMGGSSRLFFEYTPSSKKLFVASKIATNLNIDVYNLPFNSIPTLAGTIDRTAYKATNESATGDMIYNPYNGLLYVMGQSNSSTTGVNLVHRYDPTQAVASMYIGSTAIGEFINASRQSNHSLNAAVMNRTRFWEDNSVII